MSAHVTSFYSFKGGVGRTLLLVNVGVMLARRGWQVLLWDLDLEAPGMHRIPALGVPPQREGFLEWLAQWQGGDGAPGAARRKALAKLVQPVPAVPNLSLLRAFGEGADFPALYQQVRWQELFVERPDAGLALLRGALAVLAEGRDHVLIDARTGITDVGGLIAAVLPQLTVLVGSFGHQSLHGLHHVKQALLPAIEGRLAERDPHAELGLAHVVSPVPADAPDAAERRRIWREVFGEVDPVEIPWDGRLLFAEHLAALDRNEQDPLFAAYAAVAARVEQHRRRFLEVAASPAADAGHKDERAGRKDERARKGLSFEQRVAQLLALHGYQVQGEQLIGGNRVDLVATLRSGLDEQIWWVECKDHQAPTGKDVLESLCSWIGGTEGRGAGARGMVVARAFTPAARAFVRDHPELRALTVDDLERKLFDPTAYLHGIKAAWEQSELARTWVPQKALIESLPGDGEGVPILEHALGWASGAGQRLWLLLGDFGTGKTTFFRRLAYELAREQFRALVAVAGQEPLHGRGNRVLVTCRTHFFRDQQQAKDTAEGRIHGLEAPVDSALGRLARRFDAAIDELMLFDDAQIDAFLANRLGAAPARRARDLIRRTYDLGSLAPRPVLLDMIVRSLPRLAAAGGEVTPAGLYDLYTRQWLEDTSGRSLLTPPELRHQLLALLAASLWERDDARIHHTELLAEVRRHAKLFPGLDHERVDVELRTAAFLVRSADGHYRFSHKSFLEFFLALRLREALRGRDLQALDASPLSPEILAFLRDLLSARSETAGKLARAMREGYRPRWSENALRVALALGGKAEGAQLVGARLSGENLTGAELGGACLRRAQLREARLAGADLRKADLSEAELAQADLSGARLDGARLEGARAAGVHAQGACLLKATLRGADLRDADLRQADLRDAELDGAVLRLARLADARGALAGRSVDLAGATAPRFQGRAPPAMTTIPKGLRPRLPRPMGLVLGVAFSADGTLVVTGASDDTARLWDAHSGRELRRLEGHGDWVRSVAFSPDGTLVLTGSDDRTARLWDAASGRELRRLEGHGGAVLSVAISPDGALVLTGSDDRTARLWDAKSGRELRRLEGHGGRGLSVAFSADGTLALTGSDDGTARLWDAASGRELRRLEGHGDWVRSVAFSPDGALVLTGSDDHTARLWDAASGRELRRLEGHGDWVLSVAFSADGTLVLTGSGDHTARLWDVKSGRELRRLEGHGGQVLSVALPPDGRLILTGSDDGTARLWDAASGAPLRALWASGRGWLSVDLSTGRHRGEGNGLRALEYVDPEESAAFPRVWLAEDLPELRDG
ncbi:MAG: pentapeptide repeat-containing protein [Deltaproteobacteria bacterium]|nr:pentapeptide repeat-containing protein [Deltaproteobacteria bacterium]